MTERRAHWTDELIYEVFRIMDGYALEEHRGNRRHGTPTYDIIAAVEDWQEQEKLMDRATDAHTRSTGASLRSALESSDG